MSYEDVYSLLMWGRRSLRVPLVEPLPSGQRRLRKPNMATAQCSIDVFEQLDDAARVEAYRTAVSEAGALKTEVDQLRRELEGLKIMFSNGHDSVKEVDAPKPPLDPQLQASHDFFCNLLAPIVERIERLESKTREDSDAESCQSTETSAASINLQRGSGNQRGKAKDEATLCISNSSGEDARDRLSSFAASSLPHLGKDVTAWFHQVDFWFRTFSVHEEVAIPFIISRLPAKDFTWMRHHAKMVNIATWADVKAAFRRRYNIDCDVTSKQRMFGATQRAGESCTDFAYRKLDLMEQCNYPVLQKEKCQVIMATLSDKAKKHFFDKNFEKLNDMIDSFLRFDQISNTEENVKVLVAVEPPTSQTTERPVLVKRSSRKSMRNRQRKESMESSGSSENQLPQKNLPQREHEVKPPPRNQTYYSPRVFNRSQGNTSRIRKLCLNCSRSGHFVTQCRLPLTAEFLKWQEEFESTSPKEQGNDQLVTPMPASSHQ